jgi:NADH-quinone oxidoreductase subunit J
MEVGLFYLASAVAVAATLLALTRANAAHALVYLILSLLSVAVLFFLLGAPFAGALQVLVYAGAIMVLFVFVVMMLNLGQRPSGAHAWLAPRHWIGPAALALVLLLEMTWLIFADRSDLAGEVVGPREVGRELFGAYILAVELASILLLAALVGAYHLGRRYLRDRRDTGEAGS